MIAFAERIGLVLLGVAVTLVLLPIMLVKIADRWSDAQRISYRGGEAEMHRNVVAMTVVGCVLLVIFFVCDIKLLSEHFVVATSWIGECCVMPP